MQHHQVDWDTIEQLDWFQALANCVQDPIHHAEGNVAIHTKMVVNALLNLEEYQALPPQEQYILFLAALLHDIAKPLCTVVEKGRVHSPKHAKIGEKVVRELIWDADFEIREIICALVRLHGLPLWGLQKTYPNKAVISSSLRLNNKWLYLLCKADVLGRICADQADLLERLAFFKELCLENECWAQPKAFTNNHSRFTFFQSPTDYPMSLYDDTTFEIILLSGIAGSGKDTIAQQYDLPILSLDDFRKKMKVKRGDSRGQGRVIQAAHEQAKIYARQQQPFIWNSTNLTKDLRQKLIQMLKVYRPAFKIVYVETSKRNLFTRRKTSIPDAAIRKMMRILDLPLLEEVHKVRYVRN